MTPILYEKDEIDFTSQGLGSLVEIYDVDVEEQRNGLLQLTASYPVSGVRYADISVGRIILAKPNQRDGVHAFRIVSTELDTSGYAVTVEADSITYDLTHNLVKHLVASGNGQSFMTALKNAVVNPAIFAFYSDIATMSSTSLDYVNPMEAIIGVQGSFLQIWGGELKRENRRVAMFNRRGRDNVATFRLGKNISGLKYSVDISSLVTRIIPTKSVQNDDQTTTTLEGTPVDSQYINNYEQIYTLPLEFTDDTIKTVADLNVAAKGWFTQSANTGRDKPTVTIDIDVLSLQDSADYQDKFKNLESVSLTDTVTVYVPEYGVNVTAIVNELHYDPILDRVTKMTVGKAKQSFADSSRTQLSDLQDKIISVQNQADAVAVSANGKSTNYYGSVEPSHPQEGDTWFWVNGDKSGIKVFVNGDWVEPVDSDTQEKIEAAVDDAVTQAKAHTDEVKQGLSSDIATATSQAASLANSALASANSETASQFTQAQNALSDAKTDLTKSISSEASKAVAAANSQAQGYVDAAKSDVLETVNKEITDRQNAVTALDTKAKEYANTAKTDALNALTEEVTNRQNAVSALDTKATNAVNQAKSDITDTINAISVGSRNLYITAIQVAGYINGANGTLAAANGINKEMASDYIAVLPNTEYTFQAWGSLPSGQRYWAAIGQYGSDKSFLGRSAGIYSTPTATTDIPNDYEKTTFTTSADTYFVRVSSRTYGNYRVKFEQGNMPTDWTPAPEDVVLDYTTKDNQIKETITQYQTTNDDKVSKVQTDVSTALGQVATKVSQTDYDTKTGDLTTKYTQVKQTTDSQATDIVDIKETATSQASKINSISSDVDGTKQSISDIETTQDSQSDKINQITSDVNGTKQSITDIQTKDGKQDTRMGTIETSVSGVKSDFSTYKTDANGRIGTAQTTAQTAVDGLKTKVSQTDYNTKTGQLQTDLTTTTQTANQAKTDIASIKQKDGEQDEKMNTIVSDANGTKQTVSDLQTEQGKQSGYISTLQQRADGFDATVTKVDNLAVGGRNNYILSTSVLGWLDNGNIVNSEQDNTSDFIKVISTHLIISIFSSGINTYGNDNLAFYDDNKVFIAKTVVFGNYPPDNGHLPDPNYKIINLPNNVAYVRYQGATNATYKVEFGTLPTDWTPAPEDLSGATAKAQLTADEASAAVTKLTNADGIITKAQADIKANADAITKTVSKTVYDQNNGNLNKAISKAQSTADGVVSTVGNYKTSNDARVKAAESAISQNSNDITARVTKTDYDNATGKISGDISTLQQRADGFDATVTKVNNLAVGGRNLLLGTRDWTDNTRWNQENTVTKDVYRGMVIASSGSAWASPVYMMQNAGILQVGKTYTFSTYVRNTSDTNTKVAPYYDGGIVAPIGMTTSLPAHTDWMRVSITFQCVKDPTTSTSGLRWEGQNALTNGQIQFAGYKLEEGNLPTDWTPAPEDVDSATAKVKLTADEASAAVAKLTSADGVITKVQADIKLNADAINEKVSKTVYDQKTGELSRTINEAKDTADRSLKTIGDYKTSNDERVKAAESSIERTAKAITEKVSQTDYDDYKSKLNTRFTKVEATADGASTTVGKLSTAVNNLGQINRLLNTEFNPDYAAWTTYDSVTRLGVDNRWLHNGSNNLSVNRDQDLSNWGFAIQKVAIGQNTTFSFSVNVKINSMISSKGRLYIHLRALDTNGNVISDIYKSGDKSTTINFEKFSMQNAQTPAGTTVVELAMGMYGGGSVSFNHPFFVLDSHLGSYVAGNYSNSDYLAQVKITADGINNFVRDSSGNISSDFQTALSKTSIITGSTLASSIQKQTSSQITQSLTDNNGKIISLINQDSSGVQIAGKNLAITADTTVDGNFWAKQVNAVQVNASNITVGTLNGNQVNITNLNASNIVSGAISGANLNINLNTGSVVFQKGRINSSDYTTDINIDQGYISTADGDTRVLLKGGQMQFVAPNVFDLQNTPYLKVYNGTGGSSFAGANLSGRDYIALYNSANVSNVFDAPVGEESFSGISTGRASTGKWAPTKVGGADRGVIISGGRNDGWLIVRRSPYIFVGSDANGTSAYGNRVYVHADYFHVPTVWSHGGSTGANVYVASDGALVKSSSATKYKTNIEHETDSIQGDQLLTIDPATWSDKFESEQLEHYHETGVEPERKINMEGKRYYGIIAEDLVKAGLEELVTRNEETDEVEGVEYSKIGVALIPIIRDLRNKLNEQAVEIERLKDKNK